MTQAIQEILSLLRPYQKEGVRFLLERDSALLADEMGLGKTVQAAVALQLFAHTNNCKKTLIICPASVCYNWEKELLKWAPKITVRRVRGNRDDRKAHFRLPFRVWIASYEQVRSDIDFLHKEMKYDLVILDEAQRIKNLSSSVSLACRQLFKKKSWALTGTPIENKIDDLLSIFAFLKPGLIHSALNRRQIHRKIKRFFLRRLKKEVLDELPEIIIQDLELDMGDEQLAQYNNEWLMSREKISQNYAKFNAGEIFSLITRLKQICNFDPESGESCKFDAIESILEGLEGERDKIIIFSQYVDTLVRIKERIRNIPIDCFHGKLSLEEREGIIKKFEKLKGPRVLLISLRAGGVGLNLQSASMVILFDRWWNPAVENQAIHRAHRYGRKEILHVIRFIVKDSIEEQIDQILIKKRLIFKEYIDEAEPIKISPFKLEELINVLGFSPIQSLDEY